MLWDNIYKPYCASTAVAAFWRQHALKTWQNVSFLTIIKDNEIHPSTRAAVKGIK